MSSIALGEHAFDPMLKEPGRRSGPRLPLGPLRQRAMSLKQRLPLRFGPVGAPTKVAVYPRAVAGGSVLITLIGGNGVPLSCRAPSWTSAPSTHNLLREILVEQMHKEQTDPIVIFPMQFRIPDYYVLTRSILQHNIVGHLSDERIVFRAKVYCLV